MTNIYGTQLSISNINIHKDLDPLKGYKLKVIDIRKDWPKILPVISILESIIPTIYYLLLNYFIFS